MSLSLIIQNARRNHLYEDDPGLLTEEDRIVDALRNHSAIPNEDKAEVIEFANELLIETPSNKVRNAAAIFLTDVVGKVATDSIVSVLRRPGMAGSAGSLLFALNDIEARLPLDLIVDMIEQGSLEAQGEALTFLEDARLDPFDGQQFNAAEAGLSELFVTSKNPAVVQAAKLAIEYLTCLKPGSQ